MATAEATSDRFVLILFTVISYLLFGFILWKPGFWVLITPLKPCAPELLVKIYRYCSLVVLIGVTVNLLVMMK